MSERDDNTKRRIWLTGPKAGEVEPPWPSDRPLTPALEALIDALAQKAADDYLAGVRAAGKGDAGQ